MFSLVVFGNQLNDIQVQREQSATDTCQILKAIILAATPPNKIQASLALLHRVGLDDCVAYGHNVINSGGKQ